MTDLTGQKDIVVPAREFAGKTAHWLQQGTSKSQPTQMTNRIIALGVVAERCSLPDSSSGVSSRMWVRIPAVTLVSLSKTLNHNCFSPPRG